MTKVLGLDHLRRSGISVAAAGADAVRFVPPENSAALVAAPVEMNHYPLEQRDELTAQGRRRAAVYSWEHVVLSCELYSGTNAAI
jgi:glycosyltransferase involved in cell wall biosynthesis